MTSSIQVSEEMIAARVAELAALQENWDSYRAEPIDRAVLDRAKAAAITLAKRRLYACMMPHSDGGVSVNLDFDEENTLEFRPDGTATLYREKLTDDFAIYLAMKAAEPLQQGDERLDGAISDIRFGLDFAYQHGLHEFGYDPVETVSAALVRSKPIDAAQLIANCGFEKMSRPIAVDDVRVDQGKIAEIIAHSMGRYPTDDPVLDATMAVIAYVNGPRLAAITAIGSQSIEGGRG